MIKTITKINIPLYIKKMKNMIKTILYKILITIPIILMVATCKIFFFCLGINCYIPIMVAFFTVFTLYFISIYKGNKLPTMSCVLTQFFLSLLVYYLFHNIIAVLCTSIIFNVNYFISLGKYSKTVLNNTTSPDKNLSLRSMFNNKLPMTSVDYPNSNFIKPHTSLSSAPGNPALGPSGQASNPGAGSSANYSLWEKDYRINSRSVEVMANVDFANYLLHRAKLAALDKPLNKRGYVSISLADLNITSNSPEFKKLKEVFPASSVADTELYFVRSLYSRAHQTSILYSTKKSDKSPGETVIEAIRKTNIMKVNSILN